MDSRFNVLYNGTTHDPIRQTWVHQARSIPSGGHAARLRGGPRAPAAPPRGGAALAILLPSSPPEDTPRGAPEQRYAVERVPRAAQPSGKSAHGLRLGTGARPRGRAPTGSAMQGNARAPLRVKVRAPDDVYLLH